MAAPRSGEPYAAAVSDSFMVEHAAEKYARKTGTVTRTPLRSRDLAVVSESFAGYTTSDLSSRGDYMRLEGKEIVITGATDGIGKVTARELAKMGASVTIVARNATKAQTVIKELRTAAGHDRVGFVRADMSSQKSIRGAAETIKGRL